MAAYVFTVATVGSYLTRRLEKEINEKTTEFLERKIGIEEATRLISEEPGRYLRLVSIKAICDAYVISFFTRNVYYLFEKLWEILKPLWTSNLESFMNGIEKCLCSIQDCFKKLCEKCISFHYIKENVFSKKTLPRVLNGLSYIYEYVRASQDGLSRAIKFQLTKYYLEIMGLIRALCNKFNIDFLKYMKKANETSIDYTGMHNNEDRKDEPLTYSYEIPLEELLHGTERELQITRKIQEINKPIKEERKNYVIKIPPGCKENHVICLPEVGDRDPINIPADLFITIRSKRHALYKRQEADLIHIKTISHADSLSTNPVEIPLLDGTTRTVNHGAILDEDTELTIPNCGLPNPEKSGERGRLLIRFHIQAPSKQIYCGTITTSKATQDSFIDEID